MYVRSLFTMALALVAASSLVFFPGCNSQYSDLITYKVRTDPLFLKALEGEEVDPDRPGQLPLLQVKQLLHEHHPFYKNRAEVDKIMLDPLKASEQDRQTIKEELDRIFGTPRQPKLNDIDEAARTKLQLDDQRLAVGSRLYRQHCLQCHGVTGDGRGPTAAWVNPHPRDFRQGVFKFTSVDQRVAFGKPTREDLLRTLREGVEGTAMPAFNLLSESELNPLLSYVIHLSIRGEVEYETFKSMTPSLDGKLVYDASEKSLPQKIQGLVKVLVRRWAEADKKPIVVEPYPAIFTDPDPLKREEAKKLSVQRGHALFTLNEPEIKRLYKDIVIDKDGKVIEAKLNKLKSANCVQCHVDYGRQSRFKYDVWGTMTKPRDLTLGVYRGGRRPIDLYFRIHSGISGSGMQAFGNDLSGEQLWDLVNFIQTLPYRRMLSEYGVQIN